jgi:hypothetical protein
LPLIGGESASGGEVRDGDGRLIVVGPGGVAIGGGGGGSGADPLSDGTPGGALPTRTLWIAGANGTVLQGLVADATGRLRTVVEGTPAVSVSNFPATQPVSLAAAVDVSDRAARLAGHVTVDNFPATQPVSLATNTPDVTDRAARLLGHVTVDAAPTTAVTGPLTDAQLRASAVPVSGSVTSTPARAGTGTATSVASTVTTNTTILAANAARFGASIYNESTAVLFLLLGAGTESATVYTLQMAAGSYYETPFGFTGIIKGHWASANGSARVVEYT